jgi:hypothetical protein
MPFPRLTSARCKRSWLFKRTATCAWQPILTGSEGSNFRTHSLFYNDMWRAGTHVSLNLGVRWDKNHGVNNAGQLVSTSATFSPRLGVMWDPKGDGKLAVTGGFAKYTASLANTIADSSSSAGQSSTYRWNYQGPSINANANGPLVTTDAAIQQVFDWFNANGGRFWSGLSNFEHKGFNSKCRYLVWNRLPLANRFLVRLSGLRNERRFFARRFLCDVGCGERRFFDDVFTVWQAFLKCVSAINFRYFVFRYGSGLRRRYLLFVAKSFRHCDGRFFELRRGLSRRQ